MRWSRTLLTALGAAACVFVASCATATRTGSDNQLFVESEPAGASIFVNEMFAGVSPRLVPAYRLQRKTLFVELTPAAAPGVAR